MPCDRAGAARRGGHTSPRGGPRGVRFAFGVGPAPGVSDGRGVRVDDACVRRVARVVGGGRGVSLGAAVQDRQDAGRVVRARPVDAVEARGTDDVRTRGVITARATHARLTRRTADADAGVLNTGAIGGVADLPPQASAAARVRDALAVYAPAVGAAGDASTRGDTGAVAAEAVCAAGHARARVGDAGAPVATLAVRAADLTAGRRDARAERADLALRTRHADAGVDARARCAVAHEGVRAPRARAGVRVAEAALRPRGDARLVAPALSGRVTGLNARAVEAQ